MSLGTEIKKVGAEVLHAIEVPFKLADSLAAVLRDGLKDAPAVKAAIIGLVAKIEAVGADAGRDLAADGLNLPSDVQTLVDIQALFAYLKETFIPVVGEAYREIKPDFAAVAAVVDPPAAQPAQDPEAADVTTVQYGPGLHVTTPA